MTPEEIEAKAKADAEKEKALLHNEDIEAILQKEKEARKRAEDALEETRIKSKELF